MVAWLEREDVDDPSDFEVWHQQKSEYGFKELVKWISNDGTLDKAVKRQLEKTKTKKTKGKARVKDLSDEDEKGEESEVTKMEGLEKKVNKTRRASGSNATKSHKRK
jgi:hypothetical protein